MRSLFGLAVLPFALGFPIQEEADVRSNYIVGLKPQVGIQSRRVAFTSSALQGIQPYQEYDVGMFRGFAAALTSSQVQALAQEPQVRPEFQSTGEF